MRIVVVAPYAPGASIGHAGGAYLHRYLTTLATVHDVQLVAPDAAENRAPEGSWPLGVSVHLVGCRQPRGTNLQRRWWNLRNAVRGLTPGWQVLQGYQRDPVARQLFRTADVIEIQWDQMLALLDVVPELRQRPVIAVAHDIVSQSFERRVATSRGLERLTLRAIRRRVVRAERRLLNACAHVRTLSGKDADLARRLGVTVPVDVVPPLLEPPNETAPAGREGPVAFIGALWRPENEDGLLWFVDHVWPDVVRRRPHARLVATGARPGAKVLELNSRTDIVVNGFVADLSRAYAAAGVFVAPLRQGAGIKIKVVEAMLHRLPVVTTSVGAEGIVESAPSGSLRVVDDARGFADAIVELLDSDAARADLAERAWTWATQEYARDRVDARLLALYAGERINAQRRSS